MIACEAGDSYTFFFEIHRTIQMLFWLNIKDLFEERLSGQQMGSALCVTLAIVTWTAVKKHIPQKTGEVALFQHIPTNQF